MWHETFIFYSSIRICDIRNVKFNFLLIFSYEEFLFPANHALVCRTLWKAYKAFLDYILNERWMLLWHKNVGALH